MPQPTLNKSGQRFFVALQGWLTLRSRLCHKMRCSSSSTPRGCAAATIDHKQIYKAALW